MPYLEPTDVASYLDTTLTIEQEDQVEALIEAATATANTYTNRQWDTAGAVDETFDGGQQVYFPSNGPITNVAGVEIDGEVLANTEYFVYSSYIRLDAPASRGYRNVTITYTANNSLPADVKQALLQWVAEQFKTPRGNSQTVKRAKFGPGEVEYFDTGAGAGTLPTYLQTVLDRYRLMPV